MKTFRSHLLQCLCCLSKRRPWAQYRLGQNLRLCRVGCLLQYQEKAVEENSGIQKARIASIHIFFFLGTTTLYEFLPAQQSFSRLIYPQPLTPILNLHFSQILSDIIHLNLSLPILPTADGLHSVILFTILSISILTICSTHLILCAFIHLTVCLIHKSISSLVPILQLPPWFFIWPHIFLITSPFKHS